MLYAYTGRLFGNGLERTGSNARFLVCGKSDVIIVNDDTKSGYKS